MINQKEFFPTKHYDGVVILDILSRYGTVVIVLKCLDIHIITLLYEEHDHIAHFAF